MARSGLHTLFTVTEPLYCVADPDAVMHRVTGLDEVDWELEQADPLVPKNAFPPAVQLAKM